MIVTGTRATGLKVENSASPVQVLDASSLARTGQPDLMQALAQNLPSFNAQAFGGDMANMTLSARLRGLSPNNTLVLVNGKRRHGTANLAVLGGAYQGGAAADLNFIPVAAIDHIEVLQDGAAAQYGTDAIAGVINIILKTNYQGGTANVTGGGYSDGGGRTGDGSANIGLMPFETAYLSLTAESKYHGFTNRGGIDPRVIDPATLAAQPNLRNAPGYPYLNKISGDAQYRQHVVAANFGFDIGSDASFYSFATYGKKKARAFENYRMPSRLPQIYPNGFSPLETFDEEDYAFTAGVKGSLPAGWKWDFASTYGKDVSKLGVDDLGQRLAVHRHRLDADRVRRRPVQGQPVDHQPRPEPRVRPRLGHAAELRDRPRTPPRHLRDRRRRRRLALQGRLAVLPRLLADRRRHACRAPTAPSYVDFNGQPIKDLTVDLAGALRALQRLRQRARSAS